MFEQDRMLIRLQQHVLNDPDIHVCFLSGSHGRRQEDGFSDMDIALIYGTVAARDAAWQQRREFVQAVTPYVPAKSFDADHVRSYFHVALYSNGSKVDYRFESQDELRPNPWDRHLRLLKDTAGWGEVYQQACAREPWPQPHMSVAELTDLDNRFWVMYWDVWRVLLRGDVQKPFSVYLELLYFVLPPLLRLLPPDSPAARELATAVYGDNPQATLEHLQHLLQAYRAARTAVITQLNLNFNPNQTFENQIQRLVKRSGS